MADDWPPPEAREKPFTMTIAEAGLYEIRAGYRSVRPISLFGKEAMSAEYVELVKLDSPDDPVGELVDLRFWFDGLPG